MKAEKTGVFPGIDRQTYDQSKRLNWSTLKYMAKSPAHYRHQLLQRDAKDTDAMKMGRVIHMAVFEPERFRSEVAIWDGGRRSGKEWEAFKAANEGRELVKTEEYEQAVAMQAAVRADRDSAKYLAGGSAELTLFWTHVQKQVGEVPGYLLECKGRIDFLADLGAIVDLKTSRDVSPEAFGKQSWNLKYATQAAFYVDGFKAITGRELPYVIVALENHTAHVPQVYTVPRSHLKAGREEYRALLDRVDHCRKTSRWPGYSDGELELEFPRWAIDVDPEDADGLDLEFNAAQQE